LADEATLTLQALGGVTSSLNNQIIRRARSESTSSSSGGAAVAWMDAHAALSDNPLAARSSPPPAIGTGDENEEMELGLPIGPTIKQESNYSLSSNVILQFQEQDEISKSNLFLPEYKTGTKGLTFAFDYLGMDTILVGAAGTYAYSEVSTIDKLSKQKVHSALGTFYSSFISDQLTMGLLVTGGYNYNSAKRIVETGESEALELTFETVTLGPDGPITVTQTVTFEPPQLPGGLASARYNSYQLAPHFDVNYEFGFDYISLVPFIMSDCIINFSDAFTETGIPTFEVSGCGDILSLNTETRSLITFMLQNEVGLNLFEQVKMDERGTLIFRQKASYVNRYTVPYNFDSKFITDTEFLILEIDLPMQHFFGSAFEVIYRYQELSIVCSYEGFVGSGYMSNAGYFRIGRDF